MLRHYLVVSGLCIASAMHAQNATSHTFFTARPAAQSTSPEIVSLIHNWISCEDGSLQVVAFGGKTVRADNDDCKDKLATFFMPFGKTELVAGEFGSEAVRNNRADVIANYFGVLTIDPNFTGSPAYNLADG